MNFIIVRQLIYYIENQNTSLNDAIIIDITGKSAGHVRNTFKKVVGMSVDKYRIRRQLSKIIEYAKLNNYRISECDPAPWESIKGFSRAFKKEFEISPSKFIMCYDENILQMRFDIQKKEREYDFVDEKCASLIRKYGSKSKALLYQLSLEPYQFNFLDKSMIESFSLCIERLILNKYAEKEGKFFYAEGISKKFYYENFRNIEENYNRFNGVSLGKLELIEDKRNLKLREILSFDFIVSNRNIIDMLCNDVNIENLILSELSPKNLRTPWYTEFKSKNIEAGLIYLPNSLEIKKLPLKIYWYLLWILINEQTAYKWNTWDELRERIEDDYDQRINNQELLCNECVFRNECTNEDECQFLDEMSEEDRKRQISKPDYVELSIEKLIKDIASLLRQGLIYIEL